MKFAEKFADLKYLEVDEGILKGQKEVPCIICSEPTIFIDLCAEAPFCSEECMSIFYREYYEQEYYDIENEVEEFR